MARVTASDSAETFYDSIKEAFSAATDGCTITVVAADSRVPLPLGVEVPKQTAVTLDLNGHSLDGYALDVGGTYAPDSRLTVIDKAGNGAVSFCVRNGGTLIFDPDNVNTTILMLDVYGGTVELRGGRIKAAKWTLYNGVKLTDLLPAGYAYRYYYGGGSYGAFVTLADAQSGKVRTLDLTTEICPHEDIQTDICDYCGLAVTAKRTSNGTNTGYASLADAVKASQSGDTATLLKDVTETLTVTTDGLTLDLGGYTLTGKTTYRAALVIDAVNVTLQNGSVKNVTGPGVLADEKSSLTVKGDVVLDGYSAIEADINAKVTLNAGVKALGGASNKNGAVRRMLAKNTILQKLDEGGSAGDYFTAAETGALALYDDFLVVTHDSHTYDDGVCVYCGLGCPHSNGFDAERRCTLCGKQAVVRVTDLQDETKNVAWYFTIEDAFASVRAGDERTIFSFADTYTSDRNIPVYGLVSYHNAANKELLFAEGTAIVVQNGGILLTDASIGNVTVEAGGRISSNGFIGTLTLKDGCDTLTPLNFMQSGSFGKVIVDAEGKTLADALLSAKTYRYTFRHTTAGNAWVTETELREKTEIENVMVVMLPFISESLTATPASAVLNKTDKNTVTLNASMLPAPGSGYGEATYEWFLKRGDTLTPLSENTSTLVQTLDAVGVYTYVCRITCDGYSKDVTATATITKGTASCTAPTAYTLTYNGKPQVLAAPGATADGELLYSLDGENWQNSVPSATEVGEYVVYYMVKGDEAHEDSTVEHIKAAIAPCTLANISLDPVTKTYDGTANLPTGFSAVKGFTSASDGSLITLTPEDYTVTGSYDSASASESKTVTLTVQLKNAGYTFDNGTSEKTFTASGEKFSITKAIAPYPLYTPFVIIRDFENTYTIAVNDYLDKLPDGCAYGRTTYQLASVDLLGYYDEFTGPATIDADGVLSLPILAYKYGSDAAGYIHVTVSTENYTDIDVTIGITAVNKIVPIGNPTLDRSSLLYGQKLETIKLSGKLYDDTNKVDVAGSFAWLEPSAVPGEVGSFTAHWKFTPDNKAYADGFGSVTIIVEKAPASYLAPTPKTLTYNGLPQELVTAGSSADGTMLYGIDGQNWSSAVPTAIQADEYTVYFLVRGDANHSDSQGTVSASIGKRSLADASVVLGESLVYNGAEQRQTISSVTVDTLTLTETDYTVSGNKAKDAFEYTLTVTGVGNFTGSVTKNYRIAKCPVVIRWNMPASLVYDKTVKTIVPEVANRFGTDAVTLTTSGTLSTVNQGSYTAAVVGVDNPNYTLENGQNLTKEWSIAKASNNEITAFSIVGWTYGEQPNKPTAEATYGTPTFSYAPEKDGIYTDAVPENAGTYWAKATVAGTDDYAEVSADPISFTIAPKPIAGATVGAFAAMTYNGRAQTPVAAVTIDGLTVTGTWSTVTNVADKTAFTADGNFTGVLSDVTTGMMPRTLADAVVSLENALVYNGKEQTQKVLVTLEGFTVTYTVSGNVQTNVKTDGDYELTVTGTDNFTGERTLVWNIEPAEPIESTDKKTSASLQSGETLADAVLTKGIMLGVDKTTVLDGSFSWVDNRKAVRSSGTEKIIFTPSDTNYKAVTLDAAVRTYSSGNGGSAAAFTVSFETNGAGKMANVKVARNDKLAEPKAPTKSGFTFGGWFTDKALKNKYDFSARVTGDLTLYAAWTEITEPRDDQKDKDKDPQTPAGEKWNNPFDDVKADDWFYEDVRATVEKGLFKGTEENLFSPNEAITRAMFVTVLYRAEGEPTVRSRITFTDVAGDSYYAKAVAWAKQNGIVKGVTETEFAPDESITREQIAAMMFRYAAYKNYDVTVGEDTNILSYDDFDEISDYAVSAMQYAVGSGLIKGKTASTLAPQDSATRAEIAAVLHRFSQSHS